jgi:hypothetical protein
VTAQAAPARRLSAAERRIRWQEQVWDLVKAERNFEAVQMMTECRDLGRSRGWQGSCEWFAANLVPTPEPEQAEGYAHWLAIQALIWFGREG